MARPSARKAFRAKTKKMKKDDLLEFVDLIMHDSSKRYEHTEKQFKSLFLCDYQPHQLDIVSGHQQTQCSKNEADSLLKLD